MRDWIASDYPYKVIQVPDAQGRLEYICEAEPGVSTSTAAWRIRKLVYDTNGFNTQILWASGDRKFDKIQTSYVSYSYS